MLVFVEYNAGRSQSAIAVRDYRCFSQVNLQWYHFGLPDVLWEFVLTGNHQVHQSNLSVLWIFPLAHCTFTSKIDITKQVITNSESKYSCVLTFGYSFILRVKFFGYEKLDKIGPWKTLEKGTHKISAGSEPKPWCITQTATLKTIEFLTGSFDQIWSICVVKPS